MAGLVKLSSIVKILPLLLCFVYADFLYTPDGCHDLLSYYKINALKRVGPYGLSPYSPVSFLAKRPQNGALVSTASGASARSNPEPVAGVDFSETNIQVSGVDEPDIVKTDGKRVFTLRRDTFSVVKVNNDGASGTVTGKLTLPSTPSEMLIEGDSILLIGTTYKSLPFPRPIRSFPGPVFPVLETSRFRRFPSFRSIATTVIYKIDVSGLTPKLTATLKLSGKYINAREVDGIARIIIKTNIGDRLKFKFPDSKFSSKQATEFNKNVVSSTTINDWLPGYNLEMNKCPEGFEIEGKEWCKFKLDGFVSGCNNIYLTQNTFTGFSLLTVVTVPLNGVPVPRNSASIASDGDEIYSTAKSLYITTNEYRFNHPFGDIRWGPTFTTTLHKFSLSSFGSRYVASGGVRGSVLNQFSMHEFKDRFFVATTEGATWWTGRNPSKSKVTSFKVKGRSLVQIGEVGNLGIGERIYSVRYVQDTAYVVTFRQIDPLYIVDLSDPRNLVVTGELKIPGFSSYLHPISPGRILGVGRDATPEGRTTGAKVSLFDVSDVTSPKELAIWTLKGSYSTAEFEHRAFLYWAPESIAVLPLSVYSRETSERFRGSIVLDVADSGITERGRISHPGGTTTFSFAATIERNFVLGRVHLWSLSQKLFQVNDIKTLKVESQVSL